MLPILKLKDKLFYGWVVVVTSLITGVVIWGIRFTFGVFFKSIESEFELTRAATSAIFSIHMVLGGAFAILAGWALDRYGPRIIVLLMGIFTGLSLVLTSQANSPWQLFVTYSLLLAIGTGPIWVAVMSTISRWFDKKRGLTLGIAGTGAGLGPLIIAPFATYLITNFDWRTAYFVLGIIAWLMVMPLSRLLKRDPYEIGALPDGVRAHRNETINNAVDVQPAGLSLLQSVKTRSFWLIIFIFLLFASNFNLFLTHLVPHITDIGFSAGQAASVLSLAGGASVVGRVLFGFATDRLGRRGSVFICTLLNSIAMVWLLWAQDLWMFYLFAVAYGFAWGGMAPTMVTLCGDTFGIARFGAILGVMDAGFSIGAAFGPLMGGFIFDISHSYFIAFVYGAVVMAVATLLVLLVRKETE